MATEQFSMADHIRTTEENFGTLWRRFGTCPGCALHDEDGAVWFDTPLPYLPYNAVIRFQASLEPERLIDRIANHYQDRGVPYAWVIHPSSTPQNLEHLLEQRGMELAEAIPGMTMDLANLPPRDATPAGIEIREATSAEEIAAAQELIAWRWDVPVEFNEQHREMALSFGVGEPGSPLRCWVAYMDGKPVSKALLNMDGGAAGVHGVATKPEARGKGLARTLTLEALHTGREAGFQIGMLHSSPMAQSLYQKIGFRQVSEFKVYVAGASFHV